MFGWLLPFMMPSVPNLLLLTATWYTVTYTLTKYPHVLYNTLPSSYTKKLVKSTPGFPCTFSAHRGGAAERPENTLAAFQHAASLGCQLLELDVHMTTDKKVVVTHDKTTERVGRVGSRVVDVTKVRYDELPLYRDDMVLAPPFHAHGTRLEYVHEALDEAVDKNRSKGSSKSINGTSHNSGSQQPKLSERETFGMPLLDEVFDMFPQCSVNIDLKDDDEELMKETHKVIVKHNKQQMVAWGNGADKVCQRAYDYDPTIPLFFSSRQVLKLQLAYWSGLLPFIPFKERMLDIPLITSHLEQNALQTFTQRMGENSWNLTMVKAVIKMYQTISTRRLMYDHLKARGINTVFWVLQTPEEFDEAFSLGATGVMTDFPERLHKYLLATGRLTQEQVDEHNRAGKQQRKQ